MDHIVVYTDSSELQSWTNKTMQHMGYMDETLLDEILLETLVPDINPADWKDND